MDRCTILVDAGYLLAAVAARRLGKPDRAHIEVDYAGLIESFKDEAMAQTGMSVLRVMWYDAAEDARPTATHRRIAGLPAVKVRLGELANRGGRMVQKGVDSFLHRDLSTLARNRAVADVILISGDEDLRRVVEEAQDYGIRVILWAAEGAAYDDAQSVGLIGEADERWVIPSERLDAFVTVTEAPPLARAGLIPMARVPEGGRPIPVDPRTLGTAPEESAEEAAAIYASAADSGAATALPTLRILSDSAQQFADQETDAVGDPTDSPAELGARFGARWGMRATVDELTALAAVEPRVPRQIDSELLRYAATAGAAASYEEDFKIVLRAAFWNAIRAAYEARSVAATAQ